MLVQVSLLTCINIINGFQNLLVKRVDKMF